VARIEMVKHLAADRFAGDVRSHHGIADVQFRMWIPRAPVAPSGKTVDKGRNPEQEPPAKAGGSVEGSSAGENVFEKNSRIRGGKLLDKRRPE
jgi:hypothetical protein